MRVKKKKSPFSLLLGFVSIKSKSTRRNELGSVLEFRGRPVRIGRHAWLSDDDS